MTRKLTVILAITLMALAYGGAKAQEVIDSEARATATQAQQDAAQAEQGVSDVSGGLVAVQQVVAALDQVVTALQTTVIDGLAALQTQINALETAVNIVLVDLQAQIDALGAPPPATVANVDCDMVGDTLQAALDDARDGDTINVSGTCNEAIEIVNNRIQLVGGPEVGPQGASILGPPGFPAISVRGVNVRIVGFAAITGGVGGLGTRPEVGIWVRGSASAFIKNNTVKDSGWHGIRVRSGSARIENTTVTNNPQNGISLRPGSLVDIFDSTITFNGRDGVGLSGNPSDGSIQGSTISDNGRHGVNGPIRVSDLLFAIAPAPNTFERNGDIACRNVARVDAIQIIGTGADANGGGAGDC